MIVAFPFTILLNRGALAFELRISWGIGGRTIASFQPCCILREAKLHKPQRNAPRHCKQQRCKNVDKVKFHIGKNNVFTLCRRFSMRISEGLAIGTKLRCKANIFQTENRTNDSVEVENTVFFFSRKYVIHV